MVTASYLSREAFRLAYECLRLQGCTRAPSLSYALGAEMLRRNVFFEATT
jgi:hypothetical protein